MTCVEPISPANAKTVTKESLQHRAALANWLEAVLEQGAIDQHACLSDVAAKSDQVTEAYEEFCRQQAAGAQVDPAAFCAERPHLQDSLTGLLFAHRLLEHETEASPGDWPMPGEMFLGFRLERLLGRGRFAHVYQATEPDVGDRSVVVKVSMDDGTEARTLGRFKHQNIVPVLMVKRDERRGLAAVCMPYLGSLTLADVLVRVKSLVPVLGLGGSFDGGGILPDRTVLPPNSPLCAPLYLDGIRLLGAQLADALQHIHMKGIYHRDLKPSNVLITEEDRPMLMDFNLSADASGSKACVGGTFPYMSPEQLQAFIEGPSAHRRGFDARSDLFSLGVILYELATGRHPFGDVSSNVALPDAASVFLQLENRGAAPVRELNSALPKDVAKLIESCLELDLTKRPGSAAELCQAFRREQVVPRRSNGQTRNSYLLTAFAVSVLICCVGTVTAWWSQQHRMQADPWQLGMDAYYAGDYYSAIEHFTSLLDDDATSFAALMARARAYMKQGEAQELNYQLAMADLMQASALQVDGEAEAGLGYCRLLTGDPAAAAQTHFEKAIRQGFKTAEVHNNLAYCLIQRTRLKEADTHIAAAFRQKPRLVAALHNRANLKLALVAAANVVPIAMRSTPPSTPSAAEQKCMKWLEEAKSDLLQIASMGPSNLRLDRDLARLWALSAAYRPEDIDDAFKYLKTAILNGYNPVHIAADQITFQALIRDPRYREALEIHAEIKTLPQSPLLANPMRE